MKSSITRAGYCCCCCCGSEELLAVELGIALESLALAVGGVVFCFLQDTTPHANNTAAKAMVIFLVIKKLPIIE